MAETTTHIAGWGNWAVGSAVANGMPLDEEFRVYLAAQESDYRDTLLRQADTLPTHATEAYREMSQAEAARGMLISHQEWRGVQTALGQYALQRNPPRQRIVGYHNWPQYADEQDVERTRARLDEFIDKNPHVPFAYCEGEEPGELRIGKLRRLVTDLALQQTVWPTMDDLLLTNDDADMAWMNRANSRQVYDAFQARRADFPFVSVTQHVSHVRSAHLHNMNAVLRWHDDARVGTLTRHYYEPGPAWSARAYMQEPFNPGDTLSETHLMLDRQHQGDAHRHPARLWLPNTCTQLLPRREYYKLYMSHNHAELEFWDGTPNDLTMEAQYRTMGMHEFSYWRDIDEKQRDDQLRRTGFGILRDVAADQQRRFPEREFAWVLGRSFGILERLRKEIGGPDDMFRGWLYAVKKSLTGA